MCVTKSTLVYLRSQYEKPISVHELMTSLVPFKVPIQVTEVTLLFHQDNGLHQLQANLTIFIQQMNDEIREIRQIRVQYTLSKYIISQNHSTENSSFTVSSSKYSLCKLYEIHRNL